MSEPKHSNVLLGKSIREIRLRRGLTQREVSEAIGGISESALRSYELGERRPKQNTLERIVCFETGERFASVTDAASAIGAARPLVSSALKRHGACRGFHFYYADEAEPDDSVFDRKVYKNSRPIICLETNERFESQARAAKAVGVPREAIYPSSRTLTGCSAWTHQD